MTRYLQICGAWLRQNLDWSSSILSWQERIALVLVLAAAASLCWFAPSLSLLQLMVPGVLLLVAFAWLLRRGWLKLLGPVVLFEVVRTTRRSHFVLYRLYAYFILILMALCYCILSVGAPNDPTRVAAKDMTDLAAGFVFAFLILQLVVLAFLTPAYTAGIVAEEKDRGTLEFLLATDLRNREIVLSKLVARLGNVLLILLMGLPIVAFLHFVGGIDPLIVLVGFAVTGMTIVGLAGVSILNSVYARKPRTAIVMTYLEVAAYLLLSTLIPFMLRFTPVLTWRVPGFSNLLVDDLFRCLDAGNPITMLIGQASDMVAGVALEDTLLARLRDYALFHVLLALGCIAWASARLRVVFRKQVYGTNRQQVLGRRRRSWRRVGRWPMVWKEVVAERGLRFNWFGWLVLFVLVVGSFMPLLSVLAITPREDQLSFIGGWARLMGGLIACLLLLRVAVHASTSVSSERDRQTLDGLLTTPLSSSAILYGKWLGSCSSVRWGWLWLAVIWSLGVASGGLNPLALLLLLVAWSVYAAALAVLGLWFSLISPTSLRATVLTLLTALGMGMSYVLSLALVSLTPYLRDSDTWVTDLVHFQQGLSPLVSLSRLLPFYPGMDDKGWWGKGDWEMPMGLVGLGIWALTGGSLWLALLYRFRQATNRQIVRLPEAPVGTQPAGRNVDLATSNG